MDRKFAVLIVIVVVTCLYLLDDGGSEEGRADPTNTTPVWETQREFLPDHFIRSVTGDSALIYVLSKMDAKVFCEESRAGAGIGDLDRLDTVELRWNLNRPQASIVCRLPRYK